VIARGRVVVEADCGGRSRLTGLRSEGPLVLRPTAGSPVPGCGVHLVGGAGGPLGGDVLTVEIVVGPGAELTLRTVAAVVILPGSAPSVVRVDARVGEGGCLRWMPEPTVAAAGCRHVTSARVVLGAGARLQWREELVGGRHGEVGGEVSSRLSVNVGGRPLLRHQVDLGRVCGAWASPAVGGGARCTGSLLVVDPRWADGAGPPTVVLEAGAAAVLALAGPAAQVVALAGDARALRRLLDSGQQVLTEDLAKP
jgi:urease accessory protein